ncbi:MAG: histidine triad nucleotide-binding protein [Oscillospiraceae bacterium]|nr:histidine triad nucleotide-binding protein [Oscillospiraceae bacterium]
MENCLFCKIAAGEIPSSKVYEDDRVLAFRDIAPQAPVHILVIPKRHIPSVGAVTEENSGLAAACLEAVARIAAQEHLDGGFRLISNCGPDAGQTVPHLHFHILAGRNMGETLV